MVLTCDKENISFVVYISFVILRWIFIIIAIICFLAGPSTPSQIAFLVFAFIDILLVVPFVYSFVKKHNRIMIITLCIGALLSLVHLITCSCALAFRLADSRYLAGASMGLLSAILAIPTAIMLLVSKGETPLGEI